MKVPFSSLEQNESQIPPEPFFPSIPMMGDLKTTNTSFDTDEMNMTLRRNANTAFGADNVRLMLEAVRETNPDDAAFLQSESKRLNVPVPVLEGLKNQYNYSSRELMYALHLPGLSDYLLKPYAAAVSKDDLISLGETVEKYERLRRAQVDKLPLHQRLFRQDSDKRSGIKEINLWDTVGDEESLTAYFNGGSSDRLAGLGNNQRQLARFLMSEHPQTPWKELKNRPEIRSELLLRGLADAYGGLWGMNVDPRGKPSENGFLRFGQDMGFMFDKGMQNMKLSTGLNNLAADGLLDESYAKLLQKGLERRQTAETAPEVPEGFFGKIPYMASEMSGPLLETALVATVGNKAGAAANLGKLGLSGKALTKSGAAALWSKNHAGSFLAASEWYAQGRGDLYMSMRESGVDPETARAVATAGAVPYAGIEYLQFHWVTKGTGLEKLIGQKLLGKLGKIETSVSGKILAADTLEAVEQASKRSLLKSSSAFVSRALTAGAFESSEEAIQEGILISAEESAKAIDNVMRDAKIEHAPLWSSETQTGILERIWLSFADSIGPMTLVSVPGAFSASRRRARLFEYLNERKTKLSEKQRSGASLSATENSELELLQNRFDGIRDAVNSQAATQGAFETALDEQSQIAKADVFYQELEDVRATVQSTKTFVRSPENISSLLESVNSRLGMESGTGVYIDTEDLAAVREKIPELLPVESQGSIESEPLSIPYEKIFTLPDEQWKAVLPHLKSAPGALSARQAAFRKTLGTLRDAVQSVRNQYENANPLQGEIDRLTREVDVLKRNISPAQRSAALALLETRYRRMQEQIGTEETLAKLRRVHIVQGRTEDSLSDSGTFNQKNEQGETLFGVAGKQLTVPEILNDKTIQSSDFILADDGTPDWGFISEEMVQNAPKDLGLESLPIRLAKGNQFGKHHGFGLAHFFAEHGSEMEKRGIDLSDYILTVFRKISEVYISKRKNGNIRLELVNNGKPKNIGILELQKEKGYYSIVTAFPKAFDRYKLEGKKIWQYSAPTETGGKQQADALEPLSSNNVAGTAREAGDQIYNNIPQSVNPFKPKSNKNNTFSQDEWDLFGFGGFEGVGGQGLLDFSVTPEAAGQLTESFISGQEESIQSELDFNAETELNEGKAESGRITDPAVNDLLTFSEDPDTGTEPLTTHDTNDNEISKIEDFGEKIGGARKDLWKTRGLSVSDLENMTLQERELLVKRENVWKKPDYRALAEKGMPMWKIGLLKTVYDSVLKEPFYSKTGDRETARKQYIGLIGKVRDMVMNAESLEAVIPSWNEFAGFKGDQYLAEFEHKESFMQGISLRRLFGYRGILDDQGNLDKGLTEYIKKQFIRTAETLVKDPLEKRWRFGKVENGTFLVSGRGKYWTQHKLDFQTLEEAKAWARERENELKEKSVKPERGSGVKNPENRIGPDWRKGENVSGEDLMNTFGFRGGEFGNWVNQSERQDALNAAYDGLMDLAAVLNLPPRAISLNGELGIAFGSRGISKASAHYEPSKIVINLTKMSGGGSLAHEWAHALDDYFGRQGNQGLPGRYISSGNQTARAELKAAFDTVMETIQYTGNGKKRTEFYTAAIRMESGKKSYWANSEELFARAFNGYVVGKFQEKSNRSPYLSEFFADPVMMPRGEEAVRMNAAFDKLFQTIQTRESADGKIELYQEISPDQKYISKPSEKNRYLRFLEENPGNAIVKYLWDNGYVVRRPSPSEGRQVLECWEKLPKALRGNRKHGYAIDVLHKILEDAGIINGNLIYASDLYDYFSESRQMAIKLWRDMKDKDKLDELESKAYDSFHNGKSSDILSSGFLYELKRNHPEGYFSFTRMGVPATLHFENGKWAGQLENGNSFEVSANQFIRIDKHSLRIARSGGNFAENGIPVTIPSEENRPWLKRGSITQNSEGYFIRIFERGDVSTLCHEFSHLFLLEMMEMNHTDIETVQTAGLKALPEILLNLRKRYEGHISPNHRLLLADYQDFAVQSKLNPNAKETAKSFIQSKENLVSLFEISGLSEQDSDFAAFTRRELHEYFARGFERYLLQGESPSESLRSLFRKFARWLSQIYRTVLNLGITPSAELRSVFDRMLAAESEIQAEYAKRNALIDSKIKSNKENVLSAGEKAVTAAASKVREQRAAQYRKFRDAELLSSQMEVRSRREYAVYDDIRRQGGIDRIIAQETFSAETVQTLDELGLIAEDRGITDLDTLAENYTFTSPDTMIDAMLSATAFNIEVEKSIRDKWDSRPEENTAMNALLDESDALYAERSLALANDEESRLPNVPQNRQSISDDLKRLRDMTESELMTYARSEMMESSEGVGRLIDAVRYREEIVRWNERLRIALQQNDLKRAAEANFFVRLATAKLKISAEIKKETDAALKRAKNIVSFIYKEAAEKSTKIDYEFAAALLRSAGRLGFTSKDTDQFIRFALSNNTADRNFRTVKELLDTYYTDLYSDMSQTGMEGVSDFVSTMSKDPSSSYWSSHLLDENRDCEWKNLMLAELNEAVGFLKFLEQRAEMKAGLLFSGTYLEDESKAFQTISKGLKPKHRITTDNTYFPAFQKWMNRYFAEHDGLTILLKSAYGYGENAEKALLFQKLSQSFNEKTRLELEAQKQLRPALEQLMKSGFKFQGDLKTDVPVPEILRQNRGGGWTYDRILNIAFYMGSYESTQRLENYGLSFNDCLKLVEPVLSEADWKAVQQIWKMFETVTRPVLKATYERMYKGIHFDEIVPRPFPVKTSDGKTLTLEGGYFPIRYDKQLQSIAQSGVESHYDNQNDPFNPNDAKQRKPKTGSIYSRVSEISDETLFPDLNSNVLFRVLSEQITWATHAEIVSDLSRLFRNETFKKSVVSHLGIEKYLKLMPGLNYIAAGETYYHEAVHAPFNWIRNRAQKVLLSANPRTAFIQYTAIPGMIQTIGADTLFSGFKEMSARGVMDTVKEICDKSPAMRARWFNTDYAANYTKVVQNVETGKGKSLIGKRTRYYYGKAENLLTKGMMWPVLNLTDITMTAPAWWGCYRKGLELFNGDEKKSISYANEKVAEAQPVGRPMDKSYAEYSNGIYRLFNMFSSYTVRSGGVFSSRGRYLWRSWQSGKISGKEYAMYVANEGILVPLMTRAMLLLLWFRLPEDEDLKDAAWEILSVNASGMTIFRDAANFFQRKVTGSYGANFGSVQLAAFEDMLSDLIYIGKYAGTDDVRNEKAIMKGANLLSWLFGVPAKRLYNNTVKGWEEISEDNAAFSALFIPDPKYRNPTRKKE